MFRHIIEIAGGIVLAWLFFAFVLPAAAFLAVDRGASIVTAWRRRPWMSAVACVLGLLFGMYLYADAHQPNCYERVIFRC
jgi:hypothetical protein